MNVFLAASGTRVPRLLALAAAVVVLIGCGQAAAAPGALSPAETPAYVESVVKSLDRYWESQLTSAGHPRWGFRYWISDGVENIASVCGVMMGDPESRPGAQPAGYCLPNNTVYLSSSWLYNHTSNNGSAPYGVAYVVAHEVGHAVQAELGLLPGDLWVEPVELQADCFAGAWVGHRVRNAQASATDASDAQRRVQSLGDYEYGDPRHHGTPDERVTAWRTGFNGGPASCGF